VGGKKIKKGETPDIEEVVWVSTDGGRWSN